jgi:hypothetical protein
LEDNTQKNQQQNRRDICLLGDAVKDKGQDQDDRCFDDEVIGREYVHRDSIDLIITGFKSTIK